MNRILFALLLIPSLIFGAVTNTMTGTNIVPSASSLTGQSGSTFTIDGAFNAAPTGGTMDFHLGTVTLPQGFSLNDGTHTGMITATANATFSGSTFTLHAGTSGTFNLPSMAGNLLGQTDDASLLTLTTSGGVKRDLGPIVFEMMHTPQDYGAVADGGSHPLSGSPWNYTTSQAQAAFPLLVQGCTFTSSSTTITCADTHVLQVGYPISGTNIPANATVSTITDQTHFVLSAIPTGSGTSATLPSSFVTNASQEMDWAAAQQCVNLNGNTHFVGNYYMGSSTLRCINASLIAGQSERGFGVLLQGSGQTLSTLTWASGTDAIHVLGNYFVARDLTIQPSAAGGIGNGFTLGEGYYKWDFHLDHCQIGGLTAGFANGVYNPNNWDQSGVAFCNFRYNATAIFTSNNQDRFGIYQTSMVASTSAVILANLATTSGSPTVTCTSTTGLYPGMALFDYGSGTVGINGGSKVLSVTNGTTFAMTSNAIANSSSRTVSALEVGAHVDGSGNVQYDTGVLNSGLSLLSTGGGALSAVNLHFEGTAGTYCESSTNSAILLRNNLFADASNNSLIHVHAATGVQVFIEHCQAASGDGSIRVLADGSSDIRSPDFSSDVNQNNDYHYRAGPWHTAQQGDSPAVGTPWPLPLASQEGKIVKQVGQASVSSPFPTTLTWECVRYQIGGCVYSSGTNSIACTSTVGMKVYDGFEGVDVPSGTYVNGIVDGTHFTISQNMTGSAGGGGRPESGITWTEQGSGGTLTTSFAPTGSRGETISSEIAVGSAISLTTATAANVTSIALTPGDWDVSGNINFADAAATVTATVGGIASSSATLPTDGTEVYSGTQLTVGTATDSVTMPKKRISISSNTTIYLVGKSTFSAGAVTAFGSITARRIR